MPYPDARASTRTVLADGTTPSVVGRSGIVSVGSYGVCSNAAAVAVPLLPPRWPATCYTRNRANRPEGKSESQFDAEEIGLGQSQIIRMSPGIWYLHFLLASWCQTGSR